LISGLVAELFDVNVEASPDLLTDDSFISTHKENSTRFETLKIA
jgi:hypothetical protein